MSVIPGYKKVKRHVKEEDGYKLLSQWTSSQTVEMDDGTTLEDNKARWDAAKTHATFYGTCSDAAIETKKTVSCTGFTLEIGSEITVKFTNKNLAANPTLNVNNTGAKAIFCNGSAIMYGFIVDNGTYTFRYNGEQWDLVEEVSIRGSSGILMDDKNYSIAVGSDSVSGYGSTAVGHWPNASGNYSIAVGTMANTCRNNSVSIGYNSYSGGNNCIAIGSDVRATSNDSTAVGYKVTSSGNSVAFGSRASAEYYSASIGENSLAMRYSVALGTQTKANAYSSIAVGSYSNVKADNSIAVGYGSKVSGNYSIAVGYWSNASGNNSIVVGSYSNVKADNSIAVGSYSTIETNKSIVVGSYSNVKADNSIAVGYGSSASGNNSIAVGSYSNVKADNSIAVGSDSVSGYGSIAVGHWSSASGNDSIAIGRLSSASGNNSIALGVNAFTSNSNSIQLGNSDLSSINSKVSITTTSDERDKTDIKEIDDGAVEFLDKIKTIRYVFNPRELYIDNENLSDEERKKKEKYGLCVYNRKEHALGTKKGTRIRVGVSAQNTQKALEDVYGSSSYANLINDNLFDFNPDEIPEGVENQLSANYEGFIPFLIKAVQELNKRLKKLESLYEEN